MLFGFLSLCTSIATAAIVMKLPGVNGDVLIPGFDNGEYFAVDSCSFGVEREMKESGEKGGTEDINIGVGDLENLVVTKGLDRGSTLLYQFGINGNTCGTAHLYFVDTSLELPWSTSRSNWIDASSRAGARVATPTTGPPRKWPSVSTRSPFSTGRLRMGSKPGLGGVCWLLAVAAVQGAILMEIQGIPGDSAITGYGGQIVCDSFRMGVDRPMEASGDQGGTEPLNLGTGQLEVVTPSRSLDGGSLPLLQHAINGNSVGSVTIRMVDTGGDGGAATYLLVYLDRAFIKSWLSFGAAGGRPSERIAIWCRKLSLQTPTIDAVPSAWAGGSGTWSDPERWLGGAVPQDTGETRYSVTVNDPLHEVVIAIQQPVAVSDLILAESLRVVTGGSLTLTQFIDNTGDLIAAGGTLLLDHASVASAGRAIVADGGVVHLSDTTISGGALVAAEDTGSVVRSPTARARVGRDRGGRDQPGTGAERTATTHPVEVGGESRETLQRRSLPATCGRQRSRRGMA